MASFFKDLDFKKIGEKLRQVLYFRPEDPHNLLQQPRQRWVENGVTKGYRYPAPGSQPQPRIPLRESADSLYDGKFYSKDPRNLPRNDYTELNTPEPILINMKPTPTGAMKNKNPAVMEYDPTGLRSTMTASNDEMIKAVIANAKPDHLPTPVWMKNYDQIAKEREEKGLPPPLGQRYKPKYLSPRYNTLMW